MKKQKCSLCEEVIENEDETFYTKEGNEACIACYERASESASKIVKFSPDGTNEQFYYSEDFDFNEDGGGSTTPIKEQKWVQSDGWRGYTDWEYEDGFIELVDGWVTSMADDTTRRKIDLSKYFDDMFSGEIIPPCDIYWLFGNTSNVFSTASTIVIRDGDQDLINDWLKEVSGGLKDLQEKFN